MTPRARNRAVTVALFLLVVGIVATAGKMMGTFAVFNSETDNVDTFAGSWIPAPQAPTDSIVNNGATCSNCEISFSWTPTTAGGYTGSIPATGSPVTGQQLLLADGGTTDSCGSYNSEGSALGTAIASTTDNLGSVPAQDYLCYEIESTSSGNWTGPTALSPDLRLLVPTSVAFSGNADGKLDAGDTITITYNQSLKSSSVAIGSGVCQVKGTSNNGFIYIGYTGSCASGASYNIGVISNITVAKTGSGTASVSVSGNQIIITSIQSGQGMTLPTTLGVYTSAPAVQASSGTPGACNSASAPTCTVAHGNITGSV